MYKIKVFSKANPCYCIRTVYTTNKKAMQQYVAKLVDHTKETYFAKKQEKAHRGESFR